MQLLCSECGWGNDSRYHFCGMCGAKLPEPRSVLTAGARRAFPASSEAIPTPSPGVPSFLGLAQPIDGAADLRRPHWGRVFVLVFCLACANAVGWHWRGDLRNWASSLVNRRPATGALEPASYSAAPISTSGSEGAGTIANARILRQDPAAQPEVQRQGPAAPPSSAVTPAPQTSVKTPTEVPITNTPQAQAIRQEGPATPRNEKGKAMAQHPAAKLLSPPLDSGLEAEGEKYLYGSGVSVNCARARSILMTAAERSNAKAESVLGTMYATGHCTPPDLALAYRWFAKAHRLEPENARLARDLNVLWRQMTAEEQRMATRQ